MKRVKTSREMPGGVEKKCQVSDNRLRNSPIYGSKQHPFIQAHHVPGFKIKYKQLENEGCPIADLSFIGK